MKRKYFRILGLLLILTSCNSDFLEKKPSLSLVVPQSAADFNALLDNYDQVMNLTPFLNTISDNDFYTTPDGWSSFDPTSSNAYTWAKELYDGRPVSDWDISYTQIFYANVVLDGVSSNNGISTDARAMDMVRGRALFHRAFAHYCLAQQFAVPYTPSTAASSVGIPLKLSSNVNLRPSRATIKETYDQIESDLIQASQLLPDQAAYPTRPGKAAVFAMLARLYQTMQNYDLALNFATRCLEMKAELLDYNTLDQTAARPFPKFNISGYLNPEVLYYTYLPTTSFHNASLTRVDSSLYATYHENDLRKSLFFSQTGNFKGSYSGSALVFTGLATDEVLLIRAESYARAGLTQKAQHDLNTLLEKRWKRGTFIPFALEEKDQVLRLVLLERRKEMLTRGMRWTDLRRLNQDDRFRVNLTRTLGENIYTLSPQNDRYTFAIPDDEIAYTGLPQNPR